MNFERGFYNNGTTLRPFVYGSVIFQKICEFDTIQRNKSNTAFGSESLDLVIYLLQAILFPQRWGVNTHIHLR